jgi:hypothetical protein
MMGSPSPLALLETALRTAWSADTSSDPTAWSATNPAWGQCAVTALVVQDELGGELLRAAAPGGSHYWNRLPDGTELDLTREKFGEYFTPSEVAVRDREYVLSFTPTRQRYELLRSRVGSQDALAAA